MTPSGSARTIISAALSARSRNCASARSGAAGEAGSIIPSPLGIRGLRLEPPVRRRGPPAGRRRPPRRRRRPAPGPDRGPPRPGGARSSGSSAAPARAHRHQRPRADVAALEEVPGQRHLGQRAHAARDRHPGVGGQQLGHPRDQAVGRPLLAHPRLAGQAPGPPGHRDPDHVAAGRRRALGGRGHGAVVAAGADASSRRPRSARRAAAPRAYSGSSGRSRALPNTATCGGRRGALTRAGTATRSTSGRASGSSPRRAIIATRTRTAVAARVAAAGEVAQGRRRRDARPVAGRRGHRDVEQQQEHVVGRAAGAGTRGRPAAGRPGRRRARRSRRGRPGARSARGRRGAAPARPPATASPGPRAPPTSWSHAAASSRRAAGAVEPAGPGEPGGLLGDAARAGVAVGGQQRRPRRRARPPARRRGATGPRSAPPASG